MPEPQKRYLSEDPNEGASDAPKTRYLSTDPNEGEPLRVNSRAQTWADRAGMNEPTASPMQGFLRGSGAGLLDMLQGVLGNVTQQLSDKQEGDRALLTSAGGTPKPNPMDGKVVETPDTFSGKVGSALPVVAEMAMGGPPAKQAIDAIPRLSRAGANFERVMSAAGDLPVNIEGAGKSALRVSELAERGGTMPKAVRDFLRRVTDPEKPSLTYRESRDFASNISRLSADELKRLQPVVRREVGQMSAELNKANAEAAKAAGKGAEYKAAMREYANAMRIRDAADKAIKHSGKAALGAAGLGGAAYLFGRD